MGIAGQSEAEKLIEATMPLTLRPKEGDRARVLSAGLRYVLNNFSGCDSDGNTVVAVDKLKQLIAALDNHVAKEGSSRDVPTKFEKPPIHVHPSGVAFVRAQDILMSDVGRREINAMAKIARNVQNGKDAQDAQDRGHYRACRVTYDGDHMCFSPLFGGSWDECLSIVNDSDFDCVILDSQDRVWVIRGADRYGA